MDDNYEVITPVDLVTKAELTYLWDISIDEPLAIEGWGKSTNFTALGIYRHLTADFYVKEIGDKSGIRCTDVEQPVIDTEDEVNISSRYLYTVLKGETIWEIARRLGYDPLQLMEDNGIDNYRQLQPGEAILLPHPRDVPTDTVTYEIFNEPRKMHVSKQEGTRKFSFGNVKQVTDLFFTGPIAKYEKNLTILGMAHVPIGTDDYKYYIDLTAYKDGKLTYAIGYNHTHLADGYVEKSAPPIPVFIEETVEQAFALLGEPQVMPMEFIDIPVDTEVEFDPEKNKNQFKSTVAYFKDTNGDPERRHYCAYLPVERDDIWMYEYSGIRPPRKINKLWEGLCDATFLVGDEVYVRPMFDTEVELWFGIPERYVKLYSEVYADVTLPERVAARLPLSRQESAWAEFSRRVAKYRSKHNKGERDGLIH